MPPPHFSINGIDHLELSFPEGSEKEVRHFYGTVLELVEVPVPPPFDTTGAIWFRRGSLRLHLRPVKEFKPATLAHPAFVVDRIDLLKSYLRRIAAPVIEAPAALGLVAFQLLDPFGNRLEFVANSVGQFLNNSL